MQGKPAQFIDISYPHFVVRRSKFTTKLSRRKVTSGFRQMAPECNPLVNVRVAVDYMTYVKGT
jgi:hypothetical protein